MWKIILLTVLPIQLMGAPIHTAAMSTLSEVEYLIQQGAKVNERDEDKNTPLHFALMVGRFEIVKFLVENGADVNARNKWGETPMSIALYHHYYRTVTYLKIRGAYD